MNKVVLVQNEDAVIAYVNGKLYSCGDVFHWVEDGASELLSQLAVLDLSFPFRMSELVYSDISPSDYEMLNDWFDAGNEDYPPTLDYFKDINNE